MQTSHLKRKEKIGIATIFKGKKILWRLEKIHLPREIMHYLINNNAEK